MPERRRYERTPDTLLILTSCAVTGAVLTAMGEVPKSIAAIAPMWVALLWSAAFSAAAATALVGTLHREPLVGWLLELAGRTGLALGSFGYVVALLGAASAVGSALLISIVAGIGVSSSWRAWQIIKRLEALRETLQAARS